MWTWFHKLASPPHFYRIAERLEPWVGWTALLLIIAGVYGGLVLAPPDYQQGEGFRIIYVHVPSAFLSLLIYTVMAVASGIALIWRIKLAHVVATASAPVGASFTFLALATGSIWGKPMWGTWWVWDARLTSELILLFLYLGFIALNRAFEDQRQGDRAAAVLAIVGVVNVPIIHYSVEWWNTLHQGTTLITREGPKMSSDMMWPLLLMILGFNLFYGFIVLTASRREVLEREHNSNWTRELTN